MKQGFGDEKYSSVSKAIFFINLISKTKILNSLSDTGKEKVFETE
jgi:hypothetical protein